MKNIVLVLLTMFLGCEKKENIVENQKKLLLDGLYVGVKTDKDSNRKFIWVFSENTMYSLYQAHGNYADEELGIQYETPSNYYLKNNSLYICGIDSNFEPLYLNECLNKKKEPSYTITQIDTLYDGRKNEQVIQLEQTYSNTKYEIRKVFYDTIKREINVKYNQNQYMIY